MDLTKRSGQEFTLGGWAFIFKLFCAGFAVADWFGTPVIWLGLALAFNAAGNLLGGVRTPGQNPLPTDDGA